MIKWRIGCSGFYNKHWKGVFYPEKMAQSKFFDYYCEYFNSVELNTTFYRFPTKEQLEKWFRKCPGHFTFSVKAPRLITHYKKFNDCEKLLDDFYFACEKGLKEQLGCLLFQLPPGLEYSEEKLEQIASGLKPGFKNVLEFRHPSWWNKKVYDRLGKEDITFCSVDHPKLPDTLIANTARMYVRLHGRPRLFHSNYSQEQLENLYKAISAKRKVKEGYVYFNNTAGTAGILNALSFQEQIL
jgi:uncharacterized protein YecE (DUF72 family)